MAKGRQYYIKPNYKVAYGKKNAQRKAEELLALGIKSEVLPGIDPKCTVNHYQPGFGGHIDQVCPQCGGYTYV